MLARTDSRARALVLLIVVSLAGDGDRRTAGLVAGRPAGLAGRDGAPPARAGRRAPRRARRDHGRQRRAARDVGRAPVGLRHPADRSTIPGLAATLLASALDLPAGRGSRAGSSSDQPWVWLKRRVSPEVAERVRRLDIRGIGMLPETKRVYPVQGVADGTTIAAQLIGFVDDDGAGHFGVEQARTRCWPARPGRSAPRRTSSAVGSPTRRRCCASRSTARTCG